MIPVGIAGSVSHLAAKTQGEFPVNLVFIFVRVEPSLDLNEEGSGPALLRGTQASVQNC